MAQAPRPGAAARQDAAQQVMRIRVKDTTHDLSMNLSLATKMAVRSATGMPFEAYWNGEDRIGEDSIAVLWWLARRANGEPGLPWAQHSAEWDALGTLSEDDLDITELTEITDDPETDNPESSGPGS